MIDDKNNGWEVESSNVLHETAWMKLRRDEINVHGKNVVYTYVEKVGDGPIVIPEDEDGKLWMVEQFRHPIGRNIWQFPAEHTDDGESQADAAARCVAEEVGKKSGEVILLGSLFTDPGLSTQKSEFYLATDLSEVGKSHEEITEHGMKTRPFSLESIDQMIESGEIADNWTLSALALYRRYKNRV